LGAVGTVIYCDDELIGGIEPFVIDDDIGEIIAVVTPAEPLPVRGIIIIDEYLKGGDNFKPRSLA
jgi:hypothetical protein